MRQRYILRLTSATTQGEFIPVPYAVIGTGEYELWHVPKVGENVSLGDYQLEVEAMDHVRITHLRVEKVFADMQESRQSIRGDR
jgi:Transporter associated domain